MPIGAGTVSRRVRAAVIHPPGFDPAEPGSLRGSAPQPTARPARNFLSLPPIDLQNLLKNKVSVSTLQFDNLRAGAAVGSGDESPAGVQGAEPPAAQAPSGGNGGGTPVTGAPRHGESGAFWSRRRTSSRVARGSPEGRSRTLIYGRDPADIMTRDFRLETRVLIWSVRRLSL